MCYFAGLEGLCILLQRLAYPNRLVDLKSTFGLLSPFLSLIISRVMKIILNSNGYLLSNLQNLLWLTEDRLRIYAEAIHMTGVFLENCWGFINGTARPICRPMLNQQNYFSGHK